MKSEWDIICLLLLSVAFAPAVITELRVIVTAFSETDGFPALGALPQLAITGTGMGTLTARKAAACFAGPLVVCLLDFVRLSWPALRFELSRPVLGKAGKAGVAVV